MNSMEIDLWSRIDGYAFDTVDAALPFSARLARDNNWSVNFAKRAIEEYKKFVFLAMTAGHPVTPSDEVDQVWHLHLLYTRSYWEEFCKIIGRPLHHGPTQGGVEEGRKFHAWYENTLRSYSNAFAITPPTDIWPEITRRFSNAVQFRRINARSCWVITKPHLPMPLIFSAVVILLMGLPGCSITDDMFLAWVPWLVVTFVVLRMVAIETGIVKIRKKKDSDNNNGGSCGGGGGSSGDSGCGGGGGCGGG